MTDHPHGEQISAYLDGMLDVAQMRGLALHLNECADCRASSEALRRTKDLLHDLTEPAQPPSEFWTNTFRRLRTEGNTGRPGLQMPWELWRSEGRPRVRGWAAGVAAIALIAGILTTALFQQPSTPIATPSSIMATDNVDVTSLVRAHAESAAQQPLADPDRQAMISADISDNPTLDEIRAEAAANADNAL